LFGAFIDDVTTDSSVDKTDGSFLQKTSMLSINLYKLPPDKDSKTTK